MTITDYAPIMAFIANLLTLLQHGHITRLKSKAPLTYRLTVDIPARSSTQGVGLTPCKFSIGRDQANRRDGAATR